MDLDALIRPLPRAVYATDIPWGYLEESLQRYGNDWGGLDLEPDFQRGHVWSAAQQQHFIENVMRRVVTDAGLVVQFNCPHWDTEPISTDLPRGLQCIDGLQRLTAIRAFMRGEVRPFGLSLGDFDGTSYAPRRSLYRIRLAVHAFQSRAELLTYYLDINAGGTPHGANELDRVRRLLAASQPTAK